MLREHQGTGDGGRWRGARSPVVLRHSVDGVVVINHNCRRERQVVRSRVRVGL